jgi:hypothetical protein
MERLSSNSVRRSTVANVLFIVHEKAKEIVNDVLYAQRNAPDEQLDSIVRWYLYLHTPSSGFKELRPDIERHVYEMLDEYTKPEQLGFGHLSMG